MTACDSVSSDLPASDRAAMVSSGAGASLMGAVRGSCVTDPGEGARLNHAARERARRRRLYLRWRETLAPRTLLGVK